MTHPQVGTNKSHRTHRHTFRICSSSPRSHAPHTSKHQPSTHTPPFPVPFVCCCRHDAAAWWLCHRVACQAMPHVGRLRVDTACLPGHHRTPAGSPVPTTLRSSAELRLLPLPAAASAACRMLLLMLLPPPLLLLLLLLQVHHNGHARKLACCCNRHGAQPRRQ